MQKKKPKLPCINCITLPVCLNKSTIELGSKCDPIRIYLRKHKLNRELDIVLSLDKLDYPKLMRSWLWLLSRGR
jgi:hypothetical protein